MLLTKACVYALRACTYLAMQPAHGRRLTTREISTKLHIPFPYMSKVVQQLSDAKIVVSHRGVKGGLTLQKAPHELVMMDIIAPIDGITFYKACILGLPDCGEEKHCPLHSRWAYIRRDIRELFEMTTLEKLAHDTLEQNYRISDIEDFDWFFEKNALLMEEMLTRRGK